MQDQPNVSPPLVGAALPSIRPPPDVAVGVPWVRPLLADDVLPRLKLTAAPVVVVVGMAGELPNKLPAPEVCEDRLNPEDMVVAGLAIWKLVFCALVPPGAKAAAEAVV